jgi:ATP-dependent exoDNAse (exonuclease V) alpha subunit
VRENDRVVWTRSQPVPGQQRVENGVRGEVIAADPQKRELLVRVDGSEREVLIPAQQLDAVQLGYAGHVYRQQGATVQKAIAVTGGWQTSREGAYVQASRARDGIEWHIARDELDADTGAEVVDQLAARMRVSRAQAPSINHDTAPAVNLGAADIDPAIAPTVGVEIG